MKRFEYKWIDGRGVWPNIALTRELNECGKDGWECVGVFVDRGGELVAYLKRELPTLKSVEN